MVSQQGPGPDRPRDERLRDMDHVMGTVVSATADEIVVKPESGDNVTVKVQANTRIRKNREQVKLSDFKPGERVMALGKVSADKTFNAAIVAGGEMRAFGGGGAPPSIEDMQKAGLGTKFIAGEVKEINETKLTILRPDGQTQAIEVDENTSFRTGKGDSGTLADIKIGDHVMGRGEMKDGVFVPQTLRVGGPEGMRGPGSRNRLEGGPEKAPSPQEPPK